MTSAAKLVWWAKSDASTRRCSATVIQATAGCAVGDSTSRSPWIVAASSRYGPSEKRFHAR